MSNAKLFKNGRSQAVRLPKEYRFKGKSVGIFRVGDAVILHPPGKGWDLMEYAIKHFTPDFMAERNQPDNLDTRNS